MRGLRLKSSFLVLPENRVIGFVLLPIRPAELGKTTNTTFTTSNNLRAVARIALLLQGKQQNTTLRQDITPGEISRKCVQGEALFIVVSIAASLMSAWASKRRLSPRSVVSCCKSCSSCFPCVHVASLHFPEEPCFDPGPCLPRVGPRPTWFKISLPRPVSQRGIFLCHSFFSSMIFLLG